MIDCKAFGKIALLLAPFFLLVSGAKADVFKWKGGSGNWSAAKHWVKDDSPAGELPGAGDDVWIEAHTDLEIELDGTVELRSLTISGNGDVVFSTPNSAAINISGSFIATEKTFAENGILINLLNTDDNAFKQLSNGLMSKVQDSGVQPVAAAAGSCPFFTIVADPTAPTCNGSDDGIAAVLEPTDGVGPYTYQWIGGPDTPSWANLGAGTYTVIVIDIGQGGLPCNVDVFVNEPGPLTVFSMNASPPLCADLCNGTATPIVIGGNGGYTYDWSSGESGISASQLCPVFNLEVTDQLGCQFDTTYVFPNPPDTIQFNAVLTPVNCFGDDDGAIDMTVTGGVPPFVFSWTGPNGFSSSSESIGPLEPGTYTLSVEDSNNCLADSSFIITENPLLEASETHIDNLCGGGFEGEIDLIPTGGLPPYTYAWNGPNGFTSTDEDLVGLESGLYQVTVTDAVLCTTVLDVTISEPTELNIDFTPSHVSCFGTNTGSIDALGSGGAPGYLYDWTGPDGFVGVGTTISDLFAGMYYLTLTDQNNCQLLDSIEVTEPVLLEISLDSTPLTCNNGDDGSIDLTISGGTPGYLISWTGPNGFTSTDEDISGLEPGVYDVEVEDNLGCIATGSLELLNPDLILIDGDVSQTLCPASTDGAIDLTITGGTPPFTFDWTGPNGFTSSDEDISNLEPGAYTIVLIDATNCSVTDTYTVTSPDAIDVTFTVVDVLCFGESSGSIATAVTGGTSPYTYAWIGPDGYSSADPNPAGLAAGTYDLTITDFNNCVGNFSVDVNQLDEITWVETIQDASCFGFTDGSIDLDVQGGTPTYTFSWTGPNGFTSADEDISNLEAGTYDLTITDANDCVVITSFEVAEPNGLALVAIISNALCAGDSNGEISVVPSGGTPSFNFDWSGPDGFTSTDQDITGLSAGDYNLTLTDAQGCVLIETYTISETFLLTGSPTIQDVSCFGSTDGSIDLVVNGGQEPYVIAWAGPNGFTGTGANISNLESGDYDVVVTDDNGCELQATYNVGTPTEVLGNLDITHISCFGSTDGGIAANPSGGTGPYTISWTGPNGFTSSSFVINGLEAGVYTATIEDAQNCSVLIDGEVLEPSEITVGVIVTQPSCTADDGVLNAQPSGGTVISNYSYSWEDETGTEISTDAEITDLAPGEYTINVTDDNGCTGTETIELTRDSFEVLVSVFDVSCNGQTDGAIEIEIVGGTAPFALGWTGPNGFTSLDEDISNLEGGDYELSITDNTGCQFFGIFTVGSPAPISFVADVTHESCPGNNDGAITLNVSGGSPGFLYQWSGPNGFISNGNQIENLEPGSYGVLVVDIQGCNANTSIEVDSGAEFEVSAILTDPLCVGSADGSIDISINETVGSSAPFTYSWIGPDGFISDLEDISGLVSGDYEVLVTGANTCTSSASFTLSDPDSIFIDVTVQNANCQQADGNAEANATGGTGAFTYEWFDIDGLLVGDQALLSNITSGQYTVVATDQNGCAISELVVVSDLNGDIQGVVVHPICFGGNDGGIDISIDGATEPLTYAWTDGSGNLVSDEEDLSDISSGTYTIEVVDANGCLYLATFDVEDPDQITTSPILVPVSCAGDDGSISLNPSLGTAPYTIDWTGPDGFVGNGNFIENLAVGDYSYTLADMNNCSASGTVTLTLVPDIVAAETITDVLCGGIPTGSIDLEVSGGQAPYTFAWTGPDGFTANSEDIENLSGGIYDVSITDVSGCQIAFQYEVLENTPIELTINAVNPDCLADNGSISVSVSGGVVSDEYFINWTSDTGSPLPQELDLVNLGVGTYNLFVADDNTCFIDSTIILTNPGGDIQSVASELACSYGSDGTIELTIADVTAPYTVNWTGPNGYVGVGELITGLEAGVYTYEVEGADGCIYIGTSTINAPDIIIVTSDHMASCFGANSGWISVEVFGGVGPYQISWTGPNGFVSDQLDLPDLEPGTYSLTVGDDNACVYTEDFEIEENPEMILTESLTQVLCSGDLSGAIDIQLVGGTQPYTISWTGPDNFNSDLLSISGLGAGVYTIDVIDAIGCEVSGMYEITEPTVLDVLVTFENPGCASVNDLGSIDLAPSGGVLDYTVSWTGPNGFTSNDLSLIDLEAGTYVYVLEDMNGCTIDGSVELIEATPLDLTLDVSEITCFGEADGGVSAVVSGGQPDYSFSWTGPNGFSSDQGDISGLEAGEYILEVTDENGCFATDSYILVEPSELIVDITAVVDASCNTSDDGSMESTVSGGTSPYVYDWTGPDGFTSDLSEIDNLGLGEYTLNVTDDRGCMADATAEIDSPVEVLAFAGPDTAFCAETLPQILIGSGQDATGFAWTTLDLDTISFDALLEVDQDPGVYDYILHADNGICSHMDTVQVTINDQPEADAGPIQDVFAEEIFTLGGSPTSPTGETYVWYPNPTGSLDTTQANPSGFITETTEFFVTVIDGNGCMQTDSVVINLIPDVSVSSGFTPNSDGINDTWIIDNMELFPNNVVNVFDRWGISVFEAKGYNSGSAWDGTFEGKPLPIGTYYFSIELNDARFPDPITGPITIYR